MRINFDFGDLEAFLAVADSASFQRAAAQLAISQSAITRRIQKLESALGVQLFERTTRSLKPTLAAREFRTRARAMLDDAGEALRALGDSTARYQYQRNEIVTLATVPTLTHDLLPRALRRFDAERHRARINVLDLFAGEVGDAVASGEADFGIGFIGMQEPGLEFEFLLDDVFVLAMPREHPLADKSELRWQELAPYRLIVPQKGGGNRLLIDNTLAKQNRLLDWYCQVRHSSTLLELVRSGIGIAVLPASAIPAGDESPIVARPLVDPEISRGLGAVRRVGRALPSSAQALYDILLDECRQGRAGA